MLLERLETTGRKEQAKELVRLGMAAALPAYRVLSLDGISIEVAIQDAIYCFGHLYEHADEYGIDREKIFLLGRSVGAHIALSSVLLDSFIPEKFQYKDKIRGLPLCNPVLILLFSKELWIRLYHYNVLGHIFEY